MAIKKSKTTTKKRVSSKNVKSFLSATNRQTVLVGEVDRWLQSQENDRDWSFIHPSEMAKDDWCPRFTWMKMVGHPVPQESLTIYSALIFDEGSMIHAKWQNWLKRMGVLWGRWACQVCLSTHFGWSSDLTMSGCLDKVPHHIWEYMEVPVGSKELMIQGHADGIVDTLSPNGPHLIEVKSIGPGTLRMLDLDYEGVDDVSKFTRINRPLRSHFIQAQIYMRLFNLSSHMDDITHGLVLYEQKADQKHREFEIVANDKWTDPLFDQAADIAWAVKNDQEVACPHGGCKYCKVK